MVIASAPNELVLCHHLGMISKEDSYCAEVAVQWKRVSNPVLIALLMIKNHGTCVVGDASRTLRKTHTPTLRYTQQRIVPEIGLFLDILGYVPTTEFVFKNPSRSEQGTRQSLLRNELQISVRVVTTATVRATSPYINAHVHVAFAIGECMAKIVPISGNLSRGEQILGLPPVVQENAIAGVEKGPVLGIELVLVVQRAAHVNGVVPDELALGRDGVKLAAETLQELLERLEERSGNGGRFDVDKVAVEVGFFAEGGETVSEEGVESRGEDAKGTALHVAKALFGSSEKLGEKLFISPFDDERAENGNAVAVSRFDPVGWVG